MNPNPMVTNNIIMNNYYNFGHAAGNNGMKPSHPQREVSVDEIMKYVTRYKNILPHRLNYSFDFKSMLFPFEKNQIIELLQQMDLLIQLLIQNLLFSFNENIMMNSYNLLLSIINKKNYVLNFLEYLPKYQIRLSEFKMDPYHNSIQNDNRYMNSRKFFSFDSQPQISILQSPLLEVVDILVDIKRKTNSRDKLREIILQFEPLVQRHWVPIFHESSYNQLSSRTKFTYADDCLLLLGLIKFGAKKLDAIQDQFLPEKKVSEIKNRYKNLICSRAIENKIKKWKVLQFAPLRVAKIKEEQINLKKGLEWFGGPDKYHLIAKYFLPERSPEFIKAELNGGDSLLSKRKKYANLITPNLLTMDFNDNTDLRLNYQNPSIEVEDYGARPDDYNTVQPKTSQQASFLANVEEEKDENFEGVDESSQFEKITIDASLEAEKIFVDDKYNHRTCFEREENEENFEVEEVWQTPLDVQDDNDEFIDPDHVKRMFKVIGNEVFEYEEL